MKLSKSDRELVEKTLEHWDRMIKWVKSQDSKERASDKQIIKAIDECWFHEDCPFCSKFYGFDECKGCPIATRIGVCEWLSETNLWASVANSNTWGDWLENATYFREQIASLLED